MRVAIYPGSFNPMHKGHTNVVEYGLRIFDKIIIAVGVNPTKPQKDLPNVIAHIRQCCPNPNLVEIVSFEGLLADYVREQNKHQYNIHAILKGIRNSADLEDEKVQLYYNQDLSIGIPTIYVIANRDVQHISSSAIRAIEAMKKK